MLAHERSPALRRSPDGLRDLVDAGVLVSVIAASLTGGFGSHAQRFAEALVRDRSVHDIASDAHDLEKRPPDMGGHLRAAATRLGALRRQVGWLTASAPAAILVGAALPPRPGGGMHAASVVPRNRR